MLPSIGPTELVVILAIVLILFGGRKIPEIAKGLAQGLKEFRKASSDVEKEITKEERKEIKALNTPHYLGDTEIKVGINGDGFLYRFVPETQNWSPLALIDHVLIANSYSDNLKKELREAIH